MPIHALKVRNFKGVDDELTLRIKPITLFVGPNSSGKSSAIHALATLSQTLKLPNNTRPLILDDELADVHLGRFIEVMHSRSYQDTITLGVNLGDVEYGAGDKSGEVQTETASAEATYEFKCTRRTQDIHLQRARIVIGDISYAIRKIAGGYEAVRTPGGQRAPLGRTNGFVFEWTPAITGGAQNFVQNFYPVVSFQRELNEQLRKTRYLGPFRQAPLRRYPTRGANPPEVGAQGEAAVTMLANEVITSQSRPHIRQVARWLSRLGLGREVEVSRVGSSDLVDVAITLADKAKLPLADLGYGLSQVLPVLVQCSFAEKGSTLLFEQPELHLHRLAAQPLAGVFIDTALKRECHILAETHSPDLFMEILNRLRAGDITLDQVVVYKVNREAGRSVFTPIEIESRTFDVYDFWERGLTRSG